MNIIIMSNTSELSNNKLLLSDFFALETIYENIITIVSFFMIIIYTIYIYFFHTYKTIFILSLLLIYTMINLYYKSFQFKKLIYLYIFIIVIDIFLFLSKFLFYGVIIIIILIYIYNSLNMFQ